ncbi:unnamed protein product [Cuscuta campestris]|uniref:Uncharacterized protein n=1 Tax=Cuscuta campestris TaxID=132261 RepID=A0A484KCD6_9ASTE|nr:unnamed protein product [Cuscuta campestris]
MGGRSCEEDAQSMNGGYRKASEKNDVASSSQAGVCRWNSRLGSTMYASTSSSIFLFCRCLWGGLPCTGTSQPLSGCLCMYFPKIVSWNLARVTKN